MSQLTTIKNPLTIIAIFAGIAEISGTAVLPLISADLQGTFMWFVMLFPCLLVLAFFVTLNFNHATLYAPSDYRDDRAFLTARARVTQAALVDKIQDDLALIESETAIEFSEEVAAEPLEAERLRHVEPRDRAVAVRPYRAREITEVRRDTAGAVYLAEHLVLSKLSKELPGTFSRGGSLSTSAGVAQSFDAITTEGGRLTGVEVKYFRRRVNESIVTNQLVRVERLYRVMTVGERDGFLFLFVIVTDVPRSELPQMKKRVVELAKGFDVPMEVRVYEFAELQLEAESNRSTESIN